MAQNLISDLLKKYLFNPAGPILDLGVGEDSPSEFLNNRSGVDIFEDALIKSPNLRMTTKWDLNETPLPFHNNSYEAVLMLNLLEHLKNMDKALALIEEAERIAKSQVFIVTPKGFVRQDHGSPGLDSPFQKHNFGIAPTYLKSLDYKIIIFAGGGAQGQPLPIIFAYKNLIAPTLNQQFKIKLSTLNNYRPIRYLKKKL